MTRERLIEAITANAKNPVDALNRVINAAKKTLEYKYYQSLSDIRRKKKKIPLAIGNSECCILAHAWRQRGRSIHVGYDYFLIQDTCDHTYQDVVTWFDSFSNNKVAAREVLKLLIR